MSYERDVMYQRQRRDGTWTRPKRVAVTPSSPLYGFLWRGDPVDLVEITYTTDDGHEQRARWRRPRR